MDTGWPGTDADQDQQVAGFLRANPGWLAAHPDVYRVLAPPARVHGDVLADHMEAMLTQERRHAAQAAARADAVVAAGRAAATLLARVHDAVLALAAADDKLDCVLGEWPRLLTVDAIRLCLAGDTPAGTAERLDQLLGTRDVVRRDRPQDAQSLYAEAAALACQDLLVRVPGRGVLALATRDPPGPDHPSTQAGWRFLGRALAIALPPAP